MIARLTRPARAAGLTAILTALLLWLLAGPLAAQTEPDYAAWEKFATSAEQSIDTEATTESRLQDIRDRAVTWRSAFAEAQNVKSTRVSTLTDQIATLGPAPAEGATEPDDIAARRKQLQEELAVEQAPALRATEAYGRADGLIAQIDRTLRGRQRTELLQVSPSPLMPTSWAAVVEDGTRVLNRLMNEQRQRLDALGGIPGLLRLLPGSIAALVFAVLLLTVGRRWVAGLPQTLLRFVPDNARAAVGFVASLTQILLPVVGIWLVLFAIQITRMTGPWSNPFIDAAALAGLSYFTASWLGRQLFPEHSTRASLMNLSPEKRVQARRQATLLGAVLALHQLIARPLLPLTGMAVDSATTVPVPFSEAGAGVVHLVLIVLGAVPLYRLGHLLRKHDTGTAGTREKIVGILGSLVRVVAIGAPLAVAAGYVAIANAAMWPTAMTLALVGAIVLVQQFIADLWQVTVRRGATGTEDDALAPVLIGFGLAIAAVPLLALIWGARPTDLAEAWTRIAYGFQIGTVRLSPGAILTFVFVFGLCYSITRAVQGALRTSVLPRTKIDKGGQNAIVSGLGYVGIFIAALLAISSAGIDLSNLAIVAGALSVGIGFGMQNITSNFVSGIILLIERPVTIGDWVQVGNAQGYVRRISVRSTTIQTFDRTEVVVPNSDLISQQVTNWTRGSLTGRISVPVSVAYGSDTRQVCALLLEIAENQPTVLIDPAPVAVFTGFGADGLDFQLRAILSDINQGATVSTEIRHEILERFREEKIEMPFSQRDVWIKNPDAIVKAVVASEKPPSKPQKAAPEGVDQQNFDARIAHATTSGVERDDGGDGDGDGGGPDAR